MIEAIFPEAEPFEQARLIAMREGMRDGWGPRGGIEHSLIDMLAVNFSLWLHWTQIAHNWATGFVEESLKGDEYRLGLKWRPPNVSAAAAVETAHHYADSYDRQFLRVLRQLRDLRRYHVAIINQPGGQVNVGNQQLNVSATGETNAVIAQ